MQPSPSAGVLTPCPALEELREFQGGGLPPRRRDEIDAHVQGCLRCQELLAGWAPSTADPPPFVAEAGCREAVAAAVQGLGAAGAAAAPPEDKLLGTVVGGKYRLVQKVGQGGMGAVYRAQHVVMAETFFAVKLVPPEYRGNAAIVRRFRMDMEAYGLLPRHVNVVQGFDADPEAGYLVMEYVEGQDLKELVEAAGPFDLEPACRLALQAAEALAHIHARGLVHRDVKPSNLILGADGLLKLTDFGLALLPRRAGRPGHTSVGAAMGTQGYMAPEQAANAHNVSPAADVYSLGRTLTYLLCGSPSLGQLLGQHNAALPASLKRVLTRMTDHDPRRRFADGRAAAEALTEVLGELTDTLVVAVMGTNGGVGKGTLVSFLAQLLADSGTTVAVVDFDLGNLGSTLHALRFYPPAGHQFVKTVYEHFAPHARGVAAGDGLADTALWDVTPASLRERPNCGKVWLLPALDPADPGVRRYDVIANVPPPREALLLNVTRQVIDRARAADGVRCVLIDCGAGVNPLYSAAFAAAHYGFIITTPDPAFHDEIHRIKDGHKASYPHLAGRQHIFTVVNKATRGVDEAVAQTLGAVGCVYFDPLIQQSAHQGVEQVLAGPPTAPTADPWDVSGIDYSLGYSTTFQAIYQILSRVLLNPRHRELVKDETHRLESWWAQTPAVARQALASRSFWGATWAARGVALALAGLLGFLLYLAAKAGLAGEQVNFFPATLAACALGAFVYWVLRPHEQRRALLAQLATLPPGKDIRAQRDLLLFLQQSPLLKDPKRSLLRWLWGLVQQPERGLLRWLRGMVASGG